MDEHEELLRQLVIETCRHKYTSSDRQRGLTRLVRLIIKSGKLWKDNAAYYEDALQQTWMYFCRNLCEATTGEKYNPNQSSVITWLNAYLKRRLQDARIQEQKKLAQTATEKILEMTKQWAKTDPDGELQSIHIQGHPLVTCQVLILKRLPPETSWKTMSAEFNISISTLTSFYRRQCIPRLRKFGELQGYM